MYGTGVPRIFGTSDRLGRRPGTQESACRTGPPYPAEFCEEAVRLALASGRSLGELARDLGVSCESLLKWIKVHWVRGGTTSGVTSNEREELRKLRREVRLLREERDILRRAAADFACCRPSCSIGMPGRPVIRYAWPSSCSARSSTTADAATRTSATSAP